MRKGSANTGRGIKRFLQELRGNLAHAGWTGQIMLRCDSGFWSRTVIEFCEKHRWEYSITVRQIPTIRTRIDQIAPDGDGCRWLPMPDYPETGHCEIAECDYDDENPTRRLIVRRVHVLDEHAQPLVPTWDHHAFVTTAPANYATKTSTTEPTPSSNSPSATSKTTASPTAHPDASTPTAHGSASQPSPTTSPAGQ